MTHLADVKTLVELACTVEDRAPAERGALLRVAVTADRAANQSTVTNTRSGPAWRLHRLVEETQPGPRVSDRVRVRLDRQADLWDEHHPEVRQ